MLGLIIGAIFVQWATWSWVFWFVALVCMPIAVLCIFLIPKQEPKVDDIAIRGGEEHGEPHYICRGFHEVSRSFVICGTQTLNPRTSVIRAVFVSTPCVSV